MIVPHKTAKAISEGRVRQYRHTGEKLLKVGNDYPVQTKGRPALCRIHVIEGVVLPAGTVTFSDARREGCRTTSELKAAFVRRIEPRWVDKQPTDVDDSVLAARFDHRHAATLVQIIVFSLVVDEPRYLASQYKILHGHTDRGEYTARRGMAIDDLEVVDDATQERYAKAAEPFGLEQRDRFRNDRQAQAQRSEWKRRPLRRKAA